MTLIKENNVWRKYVSLIFQRQTHISRIKSSWFQEKILDVSHMSHNTRMSFSLKFPYIPMIAQPASERALWPQRTTVSPSQRRRLPTVGTRHCERCWKAEGPKVRAPNTQPRTRTPPPPVNAQTRKRPVRSLSLLSPTPSNSCRSQRI